MNLSINHIYAGEIKNLMEDNPIKRMLLEKKQKEAEQISQHTQTLTGLSSSNSDFKAGDRVFHSKFGVGKIVEIKDISSSTMIIADFGKFGQKALDAAFSQLKKF